MGLHFILQHLDRPGTYVRILYVDFSFTFNTIIPSLIQPKLTLLSVPTSVCLWITSFLTDRQKLVRLDQHCTISTGAPQGCVFSPLLFSLYTNDCTSKDPSVKLLKFADDTTLIGLIQDGDESAYRQEIKELAVWCSLNNLELNMLKSVEMIVDFRRNPPALPPSPSWTALWLQWSHSGSWAPPSPRTWSGTIILSPLWKRPSRGYISLPAEKVPPATGAAETVWLCHHWISPLHVNNCLVQLSYQIWPQKTTKGSPDCWANHWYSSPQSPRTVLIQSEQKGWQNHYGPLTFSTLSLWTVTFWSTLQSSEHQNPSHEHLTINVEHTTLLYIIYTSHILIFISNCTFHTCTYIIVYIKYCVFAIL